MKIIDLVCVPVRSGFYREDLAAIRAGAPHDGFLYLGDPVTPGFAGIREPGIAISVMLVLSDGSVALGDCAEVQYPGAGGRSQLVTISDALAELQQTVAPVLIGREITGFRLLADEVESLTVDGQQLSTAVRFGVSQALLNAAALAAGVTMAEVVQSEYSTGIEIAPVPLYAQSGDDRYLNVDKMILHEVDVLPHGLINDIDSKLGADGSILKNYILWLVDRVSALRVRPDYQPRFHFDTYGTIGIAFGLNIDRIADYLGELSAAAAPFRLRIEHPIDAGSRENQIETYVRLRQALADREIAVDIVVDEWCNTRDDIELFLEAGAADVIHVKMPDLGGVGSTIEALLRVRASGVAALCGGSCNETDVSARVSAHIAMACGADQLLAKPGMGVDEALMIVGNEMARTMALSGRRPQISTQP